MDDTIFNNFSYLIAEYGYLIIILSTFLEGETVVILAGVFVHSGDLKMQWVIVTAFLGAFLGDQLYFFLGKQYGTNFLKKRPKLAQKSETIIKLINKHENLIIISFRFLYGLRTITPVVLGMSNINHLKFFILNFIGALAWASIFTVIGYLVADSIAKISDQMHYYQYIATGFVIIIALILFIIYRRKK